MNTTTNKTVNEEAGNTILLVDDEENIIRSLVRLLRRDGYNIITANGGKEGLEVLKEKKVGVILSDQRMPEMSGVEFLSQVKELYPETVRMALSGYTDLNSVTDAINHGAIYKFLTKPWEDDLLRSNVDDAFKHYRLYTENKRLSMELKMLRFTQEVMNTQPIGILGINEKNIIALANVHVHEMLNVPQGSLLKGDALQLLPDNLQSFFSTLNNNENKTAKTVNFSDSNYQVIATKMNEITEIPGIVITLIPKELSDD
jgi:response regulator RpfG family c-di-GMP phosphodiesterase